MAGSMFKGEPGESTAERQVCHVHSGTRTIVDNATVGLYDQLEMVQNGGGGDQYLMRMNFLQNEFQ